MKQIYSALTAIAFFVSLNASSQISQNFNSGLPSSSNCWYMNNMVYTNPGISGGSASAEGGNNTTSTLATPTLALNGNTSVSFQYKLTANLNGSNNRLIQIGTLNSSNVFSPVHSITVSNSNINTANVTIPSVENARIAIVVTRNGSPATNVWIDDLIITGTTPFASDYVNEFVSGYPYNPITGNLLMCLNSQNSTPLTTELVTDVQSGELELNADGSFTHIPAAGFSGGVVTFNYRINYNGQYSNTGEVSLNYAMQAVLPVKLLNFSGIVVNQRAELKWTLEANETGEFIQVEKSIDGKSFALLSVISNTAKAGTETYTSKDNSILTGTAYYRLKMVNKSGSVIFSKIIVLKNTTEVKANSITVLQNPVQSSVTFNYSSSEAGVATIAIYNTAGMKLLSFQKSIQKGINTIDQPFPSNLSNGTYIMEVIKDNERSVVKLLK